MERVRSRSLEAFGRLLNKGYDLEVKNRENLTVLCDEPKNPAVVIFNHTATDDPLIIYQIIHKAAPERMNNVIVPVSESHAKFKKFPAYSALVKIGNQLWGFETPQVVQSYRLRTEGGVDDGLSQKSSQLGKSLFRLIDAKLFSGPLLMLSPEGHRSESGTLLPAEGGVGVIAQLMQKQVSKSLLQEGYFLPIGIRIAGFEGKKIYYNPLKRPFVECTIGEPITSENAVSCGGFADSDAKSDPRVISHYLMSQVARLLPEEMQGVYHSDYAGDTFMGRFEQRSSADGRVFVYDNWNQTPFFPSSSISV
jgi:hypothetical protein